VRDITERDDYSDGCSGCIVSLAMLMILLLVVATWLLASGVLHL
jgi:hypothetical protein